MRVALFLTCVNELPHPATGQAVSELLVDGSRRLYVTIVTN
jgi:hypothetical protein